MIVPKLYCLIPLHYFTMQADRLQRAEDEKKFLAEQKSHHMKDRGHSRHGKERSVFGEVAKGVGFITADHQANHGR